MRSHSQDYITDLTSLMLAKFEEILSTISSITTAVDYPAMNSPVNHVSMAFYYWVTIHVNEKDLHKLPLSFVYYLYSCSLYYVSISQKNRLK